MGLMHYPKIHIKAGFWFFSLLAGIFIANPTAAQKVRHDFSMPKFAVGAKYGRGFLAVHSPVLGAVASGPVNSLEVFFETQTTGKKHWHSQHAFPALRFYYSLHDFSNPAHIGLIHSLAAESCFPLVRKKHFTFNFNTGLGLGYCTRPFDAKTNNINAGLATHFNFQIRFAFEASARIGKNVSLFGGLSFTHWSIGALKVPNLGLNVPQLNIGLKYGFANTLMNPTAKEKFTSKPYEIYVLGSFCQKQISPINNISYATSSLTIRANKQLTHKSVLCAGIDFMYDGTSARRLYNRDKEWGSELNKFRIGVHFGYEFLINRFSAYFNFGVYALKTESLDTPVYQRIGVAYRIGKNWMVSLGLKSHFFSADFVEPAIGYKIASFKFKRKKNEAN